VDSFKYFKFGDIICFKVLFFIQNTNRVKIKMVRNPVININLSQLSLRNWLQILELDRIYV